MLSSIALLLHLVAINIWVGGSFFAIVILGKGIIKLETQQQLLVWQLVLKRFFFWAWIAVAVLLSSGTGLIYLRYAGFQNTPLHILLMGIIALLMVLNFLFIYLVPYRQFRQLVQEEDVEACLQKLHMIRMAGILNLVLGICIVFVITGGPYLLY